MLTKTLTKVTNFCRQFTTTAHHQSRIRNKKVYVQYGPKWLLYRRSRMNTSNMHKILPHRILRLTAQFVNERKIGGSSLLAERMAVHVVPPIKQYCEKSRRLVTKPEMIPEFIIPDLKGFKLKPYVPYNAPEIKQSEFTYKDLFNACYVPKIMKAIESGKIRVEDGEVIYDDSTVLEKDT